MIVEDLVETSIPLLMLPEVAESSMVVLVDMKLMEKITEIVLIQDSGLVIHRFANVSTLFRDILARFILFIVLILTINTTFKTSFF